MRFWKIMLLVITLTGCGMVQKTVVNQKYEPVRIEGKAVEERIIKDLVTIKDDLEEIPEIDVDFRFYKGVDVKDFMGALAEGVPALSIMIDFFEPENKLIVPRFKGTLREFFRLLQQTYGYSYRISQGTIIIEDNVQVVLKVPSVIQGNEKKIKDMLSIFQINAEDVHIDMTRGVVVGLMNSKQYRRLKEYLRENGIYQYQIDIAVIEDTTEKTKTVGVDLSKLSMVLTNIIDGSVVKALGNTLSITTSGATAAVGAVVNNRLSIDAIIAAYGSLKDMRLDQRITLGVLSGSAAKVDLSRKVPYVSKINATSGNTGAAVSGYEFETAQDGLVIEIKPSGDDSSVNLDATINYQQVLEYVDLATGEYKVSRPIVQSRTYKTQYCVRPGEVSLIGALRVLNAGDTKSGLLSLKTFEDEKNQVTDLSVFMGVSVVKYKMM